MKLVDSKTFSLNFTDCILKVHLFLTICQNHLVLELSLQHFEFSNTHYTRPQVMALCSRNFQNVKLRLDFVEIWSIYRNSNFTWNQILANSNSPKMLFLSILEVLNFDFSHFEQLLSPKFTKIQNSESLKLPKVTFLHCLN